jgi:ParB family chromosome partitioning protein
MLPSEIKQIPLAKVRLGSQVRQHPESDEESLAGMSETIKSRGGVLQPIGVWIDGDSYVVIWGHRRTLAAIKAGLLTIPAMVWPSEPAPDELAEIRLIENTQRQNLGPLELANGLQQLISISGLTATEVAGRLGMSVSSVSRSLKLLELPEAIRLQVDRGEVSASSAYEIALMDNPSQQAAAASKVADGLTRDGLKTARKASCPGSAHNTSEKPVRCTVKITGGRSVTVWAPGLNLERLIFTLEEVLNRAREAKKKKLLLNTFCKMQLDQSNSAN